ncbi:hypothetical protein F5Y18DRAFT_422285 [Xylariaceae sp. FL1019]|nr:hypothetical protein F5Y18DRAFT_422285 [Xylariaceae sp. FL1019]
MEGTGQKSCLMCDKAPAALCTQCNSACYCSKECQRADWPIHKILCKTFGGFDMSTRPSKDHYLCVLFPEQEKPKLVWVHCPLEPADSEDGHENTNLYDQLLEFYDHLGGFKHMGQMVHFDTDNVLKRRMKKVVGIVCREKFTFDGSLPNRSIEALKATNARQAGTTRWAGPVLGYATTWRSIYGGRARYNDVDMKDFRHIADSLITYPDDRI